MILNFKEELIITYSSYRNHKHGICGHLFEAIDYYYILKEHFECKIAIPEFNIEFLETIIQEHYNFNEFEFNDIINNIITYKYASVIKCNNILFCDSNYNFLKEVVIKGNKFGFSCGSSYLIPHRIENYTYLEDFRIYPNNTSKRINYVKKILLDKLRKPSKLEHKTLIYTSGCRHYNFQNNDYLVIDNTSFKRFKYGDFDKYIYTPIKRRFDCSNRMIVECDYLNIEVEFMLPDKYNDIGLNVRLEDLKNKALYLRHDDNIINIVKELIESR